MSRFKLWMVGTAAALTVGATAVSAQASTWEIGDVFANTPDGATAVKVYDNNGNFKEEFGDPSISGEGTGCAFNSSKDLYATYFQNHQVHIFQNAHPHPDIGQVPSPGTNESIVFDAAGNFYVGIADPGGGGEFVQKFDSGGNLLDSYTNLATDRGADWIELSADQRTLFYAGEGQTVRRYDLVTHTQLADFAVLPSGNAFASRLLPPGDGSGGLLLADGEDIKRLDSGGNVIQTYDVPAAVEWFALNLDPNGTSFWSADINTGIVARFNIASGAVEVGPFQGHPSEVAGLCVLGELTAAVPQTPPAQQQQQAAATAKASGVCHGQKTTILGTNGNDTLTGTNGVDVIQGLEGKDKIKGLGGNDVICGAWQADNILGGSGNDILIGGAGPDHVVGGPGRDHLFGGTPGAPPGNAVNTCIANEQSTKKNCQKGN
jgi:Ca2+-binding RTX toxin-like protein